MLYWATFTSTAATAIHALLSIHSLFAGVASEEAHVDHCILDASIEETELQGATTDLSSSPQNLQSSDPEGNSENLERVTGRDGSSDLMTSRSYYLDNLKTVLTVIVILHHCTCAFRGAGWYLTLGNYASTLQPFATWFLTLNQSYFMSLFFFISAYFTPLSFDRKGQAGFLRGKFKRLGLPLFAYLFGAGPVVSLVTQSATRATSYSYSPNAGPCWFLVWLLLFNCGYTLIGGEALVVQRPSTSKLIGVGAALGGLQLAQISIAPSFVFMPITLGSLPFDICFFTAGVVARRNKWLEEPELYLPLAPIALVVCTAVGLLIMYIAIFIAGDGMSILPSNRCGEDPNFGEAGWFGVALLAIFTWAGVFALCVSYVLLWGFKIHGNLTSPLIMFSTDAAYGAYLIHPLVVVPITWSFIRMVEFVYSSRIVFPANQSGSTSCLTGTSTNSDNVLFIGWVFTSVSSVALSFILASWIKKLPGFKHVL